MTTSPQRTGRATRTPRPRRSAASGGYPAAARGTDITLDQIAGADGGLSMLDEAGNVVQAVPASVTESLRYMLARLRLGDGGELPERLAITSAIRGEGVTFLSRALALVLTNDAAKRVCIVDLNWWAPSDWPSDEGQIGVADVLRDGVPIERALIATGNPGLHVLPAGIASPAERPSLARSPELEKMLVTLSEEVDHVLVDLPAVHATSEALTLAESCGSLAMVIGQGLTPDNQVKAALDELSGVSMLGVILNRSYSKIPRFLRNRIPGV
jgi:Mrp family chromosome partitioning ATPase